jgi:hypothetical protein
MPERARWPTDDVEKLHSPTPSAHHKRVKCSAWANALKEPGDCNSSPTVMQYVAQTSRKVNSFPGERLVVKRFPMRVN